MTSPEPSWDLYRTFLAVMREGSLSGAGRALGLTQPTVGRHVDALEAAVGASLFTRSQHGLAPSEAAAVLLPYAETLESTAASLLRAASGAGREVRGTVRISASEIVGVEVLPPILAGLRQKHPRLEVELVVSNTVEDLLRGDADIAVRMVEPKQESLVARRIGDITLGLFAHKRYLARCGTPTRAEDLAAHTLIGFDKETPALRALRARVPALAHGHFAWRADSDLAQLAAIRAGFGLGICQVRVAARTPELVRILPKVLALKLETWVAMHESQRSTPRCRAVFDGLAAGLGRHVD